MKSSKFICEYFTPMPSAFNSLAKSTILMLLLIIVFFMGTTNSLPGNQQSTELIRTPANISAPSFKNMLISRDDSISESEKGRTFGKVRRLKMLMIPFAFKFGIMFTIIGVILFLVLKSVFLLKMLLFINAGVLLVKLIGLKSEYKAPEPVYHQPFIYGHHIPFGHNSGWEKSLPVSKEIHLHIHNSHDDHIKHIDWPHESNSINPYSGHERKDIVNYVEPTNLYAAVGQSKSNSLYRNYY